MIFFQLCFQRGTERLGPNHRVQNPLACASLFKSDQRRGRGIKIYQAAVSLLQRGIAEVIEGVSRGMGCFRVMAGEAFAATPD